MSNFIESSLTYRVSQKKGSHVWDAIKKGGKKENSAICLLKYSVFKFSISQCSLLAILATILKIKLKF